MGGTSCGRFAKGVENISPSETGTTRGNLRDVEEAGKPGSLAGGWHRREARSAGRARQLADPVRRDRARPPLPHTWRGPCFILPDPAGFARTDTPEFVRAPSARHTAAGAMGSSADTRQPPARVGPQVKVPPQAATRSRMPARPKPDPDRSSPEGRSRPGAFTTSTLTSAS